MYTPVINHCPSREALGMALGVRGHDVGGTPTESLRALSNLTLPQLATEYAYHSQGIDPEKCTPEEVIRAEFFSGGMMQDVFADYVNTVLKEAYNEAPDKTVAWEVEVENYLPGRIIRVQDNVMFTPRGHGAASLQSVSAFVYEWRLVEFARSLIVDEKELINDNFGAIRSAAKNLGRGPRRLKNDLFYSTMLQNPVLPQDGERVFSAAHNNYLTGTTSELMSSQGGLALAVEKLRSQIIETPDGIVHPELEPAFLVVGPALENSARQSLRLRYLDNHEDNIRLIVTSRMSAGVTDPLTGEPIAGSDTSWALFADPADAAVFAVGFLRGQKTPTVRVNEISGPGSPGQWGLIFDTHLPMACTAIDYRGGVWSDGK
jgi:hypothetical protein